MDDKRTKKRIYASVPPPAWLAQDTYSYLNDVYARFTEAISLLDDNLAAFKELET